MKQIENELDETMWQMVNPKEGYKVYQPNSLKELAAIKFCEEGLYRNLIKEEEKENFKELTYNIKFHMAVHEKFTYENIPFFNPYSDEWLSTVNKFLSPVEALNFGNNYIKFQLQPNISFIKDINNVSLSSMIENYIDSVLENERYDDEKYIDYLGFHDFDLNTVKGNNLNSLIMSSNYFLMSIKSRMQMFGLMFEQRNLVMNNINNF